MISRAAEIVGFCLKLIWLLLNNTVTKFGGFVKMLGENIRIYFHMSCQMSVRQFFESDESSVSGGILQELSTLLPEKE